MDLFDQVRSILPWWVTWGMAFVHVATAGVACFVCGWIATQFIVVPLKTHKDASWPERARLANAGRAGQNLGAILWPAGAAVMMYLQASELSAVRGSALAVVVLAVGYAATLPSRRYGEQRILQAAIPWSRWLREDLGMWLVRLAPFVVILAASLLVSDRFDLRTFLVLAGAVACMAALHRGLGLQMALAVRVARPASERLRRAVQRASDAAGNRPRRLLELAFPWANAFAWPLSGRMVFSERATDQLTDEELTAIATHELAHLAEPRRVAWARSVPGISLVALAVVRPLASVSEAIEVRVMLWLAVWCFVVGAILSVRRMTRAMEERADASAHAHEADPGIYARALEHIYRINVMPVVTSAKRASHPHLYDRMLSAGLKPSYERPRAPSRFAPLAAFLVPAFVAVVPVQIGHALVDGAAETWVGEMNNEAALMRELVLRGSDGPTMQRLAEVRWKSGREQDALLLLRGCAQIDPHAWRCPAREATLLASQGRCEEASEAAEDAEAIVALASQRSAWPAALVDMRRAIDACATAAPR